MRKHYNSIPENRLVDPECDAFHAHSRRVECRTQRQKSVLSKHADVRARACVTGERDNFDISSQKREGAQCEFLLFFKRRHQRAPSGRDTLSPSVDARDATRAIHALRVDRPDEQSMRNRAPSRSLRKSKPEFGRSPHADRSRLVESVKRGCVA